MSFLSGLIVGCGIGAVGHYCWQHYVINKSHAELMSAQQKNDLAFLFEAYPYLMNLIKNNLCSIAYKNVCEFFVVDKSAIMNSLIPRMRYDLTDDMMALLKHLSAKGYIERLENDSLLYRMNEEFIIQLKNWVPEHKLL